MRITIQQIKDYIRCPLYYKFVHVNSLPLTDTLNDFYKEYLKLSIYFYYFSVIENKTKSFDSILRKWESLWFSSQMVGKFISEALNKKSNEAVIILGNVYKKIRAENITPIAVNFTYEAIFEGADNIHITGNIDLIRILHDKTRRRETHIVFFSLARNYLDEFLVKGDIPLSIASYGFRSNFKEQEDKIIINNILCKDDNIAIRSGADYHRAEKAVRNICRGIEEKIFYPVSNKLICSNCQFKLFCINEKAIT